MKKILVLVIITLSLMSSNILATTPELNDNYKEIEEKESQGMMYHDIIITALSPAINKAIENYYKNILKYLPESAMYMTDIKKVSRPNGNRTGYFIIEIEILSFVGPHLTVGKDLITIELKYPGETKILDFKHLEDHELPEHYNHIYLRI